MIYLLCFFLALPSYATSLGQAHLHDDAERDYHPKSMGLASGQLQGSWGPPRHPWPVRVLSIGHTNASYQDYGTGAYFHHGIDIRADAASPVFASAGGKVVNIENYVLGSPAYWEIAILDSAGFLWQYHHIDRGSIPQSIHDALKSGAPIPAGTKIGEVFYWSEVTFGERYHHIHLNIIGKDKAYLNPFAFLEPLADNDPPRIENIQVKKLGTGYTIHAEVSDLVLHKQFLVPPYEMTFELDGQMPVVVWRFDGLPGGDSTKQYVNDLFRAGTCGNYSCRKFIVDLGFKPGGAFAFPKDSQKHEILFRVKDFSGNAAEKRFEWVAR